MLKNSKKFHELTVLVVAIGFLSCSWNFSLAEPAYYLGKLRIEKAAHLTPDERAVEARFAGYLQERTEEAIARYREAFGKELNTDNARELSEDYAPGGIDAMDTKTKAARVAWSNAVHEPASALVSEIYRRELKKPAGADQLDRVVFTAGGAGVGKSSSIRQVPGLVRAVDHAQIIYDTTLSSYHSAVERINLALQAGKTVSIVYVYRDPVESLTGGALQRAERMGRTLPLEVFLKTHMDAGKVVLQLAQLYRDDPRVEISVIDNSRGKGKAAVADLEFLRRSASKYTEEGLRAKLNQALEDAHDKGKRGEEGGISETVYRGFKSDVSQGVHGSAGRGDGRHSEPQNQEKKSGP